MRGLDDQPAAIDHVLALVDGLTQAGRLEQRTPHVVAEERVSGADATVAGLLDLVLVEADLLRLPRLLDRDQLELGHPIEYDIATVECSTGVAHRIVGIRVLYQSGQHRCLCQRELVGLAGEVVSGGGLNAVRALTVVGNVEVALEDLILGELLLHRDRVAKLANLALHRRRLRFAHTLAIALGLARLDLHHLDVLLSDRRATLCRPTGGGVADQCPHRALEVQGAVFVVAVILDGQLRLPHDRGDVLELHRDAVLVVEVRQSLAVAHQHLAPG